jgi:hypothetical protein
MPMRGELSIPAMSTGQRMRPAESTRLRVFGIFRSLDLAVVVVRLSCSVLINTSDIRTE